MLGSLSVLLPPCFGAETEQLVVPRDACQSYSVDMCPGASMSYSVYTYYLSFIGLFLNEAGKWACDHNDYCGNAYWGRGGACMQMSCAAHVEENRTEFCSKRMTGCSRSCGCALGGEGGRVTMYVPPPQTATAQLAAEGGTPAAAPSEEKLPVTTAAASSAAEAATPPPPYKGKQRPLFLWLHGYTGEANWAMAPGQWGVDRLVDREGWLVASPEGGLDDVGFPYWDSGSTFHGLFADPNHSSEQAASDALNASHLDHRSTQPPASWSGLSELGMGGMGNLAGLSSSSSSQQSAYNYESNPDVDHLLNVLEAVQAKYSVDPQRIYVGGSANGGLMAYYLACRHSHLFAGVLVHGAGQNQRDLDHCHPTTPMHVLHIHGTKDFFPIRSVRKGLGVWADLFGCNSTDIYSAPRGENEAWFNTTVNVFELDECQPGGSVTLWQAEGANHAAVFTDAFPRLISQHVASRSSRRTEPQASHEAAAEAHERSGHARDQLRSFARAGGGARGDSAHLPAALQPRSLGGSASRQPLRRTHEHETIPANESIIFPF